MKRGVRDCRASTKNKYSMLSWPLTGMLAVGLPIIGDAFDKQLRRRDRDRAFDAMVAFWVRLDRASLPDIASACARRVLGQSQE